MARTKKDPNAPVETPDTPSPKDLAMLAIRKKLQALVVDDADAVAELAREAGWTQYKCTPGRHENYEKQFKAIVGRFEKKLTETLAKRAIK